MTHLIKATLWLSDICAWLLCLYGALAVFLYPIAGPIHARMISQSLSPKEIIVTSILFLLVAVGAFLITRRKPLGVVLVTSFAAIWLYRGLYGTATFYVLGCLLVFGTPFALISLQVRRGSVPRHET